MSVEREQSLIRFTCDGDGCRRNYEGVDGFGSAWAEAKCHGWVTMPKRMGGDVWLHYCPACKRDLGDD